MDSIEAVARENESLYRTLDEVHQISYELENNSSEADFENVRNNDDAGELPAPAHLTWDVFDRHIQCIDSSDSTARYRKKRATDTASATFQVAMQDICESVENLEITPSDAGRNELATKDETNRYRSGTNSKRNSVDVTSSSPPKDVQSIMSKVGQVGHRDGRRSRNNGGTEKPRQPVDENTKKRMILYERYLERQNAWAEGLTKSGKDILAEIQKKRTSNRRMIRTASIVRSRSKAAQKIVRTSRYHSSTN